MRRGKNNQRDKILQQEQSTYENHPWRHTAGSLLAVGLANRGRKEKKWGKKSIHVILIKTSSRALEGDFAACFPFLKSPSTFFYDLRERHPDFPTSLQAPTSPRILDGLSSVSRRLASALP